MHGPIFGEFFGMAILVFLGDGVCANLTLKGSKGSGGGWIVVTTAWGLAVLLGVTASLGVGGVAHLNPAVTVASAIGSGDYSIIVPYIAAQMVGAILGAALVWLAYLPLWEGTEDQAAKLGIFCTAPAIRNLPANCITEFLGTVVLVVVGFSFASKGFIGTATPMAGFNPYLWGMLVWGIGLSLGGPTGYAINPARDLGPRIAHAILPISGKGGSDWGYSWVPVAAPIAGGIVGVLICKATGIA